MLKNNFRKFVSIITLICFLLGGSFLVNNNTKNVNMAACAGLITWPAFAAMAVPAVVFALMPAGKAAEGAVSLLTTGEKGGEIAAKLLEVGADKVLEPNPINLAWTVIDVILMFTPAGPGIKAAKLTVTAFKIIPAL